VRPRARLQMALSPAATPTLPMKRQADGIFRDAVDLYQSIAARDERSHWTCEAARDEQLVRALRMLEEVFRLDFEVVESKFYTSGAAAHSRTHSNVTCMRPRGGQHDDSVFIGDQALLAMDLEPGRLCEGGACCDACSRVQLSSLASAAECAEIMSHADLLMPPGNSGEERHTPEAIVESEIRRSSHYQHNLPLHLTAAAGDIALQLLFIRLIERLRRATAHEYGLPLRKLALTQSFVSRMRSRRRREPYECVEEWRRRGQEEMHQENCTPLHVDECSTVSSIQIVSVTDIVGSRSSSETHSDRIRHRHIYTTQILSAYCREHHTDIYIYIYIYIYM